MQIWFLQCKYFLILFADIKWQPQPLLRPMLPPSAIRMLILRSGLSLNTTNQWYSNYPLSKHNFLLRRISVVYVKNDFFVETNSVKFEANRWRSSWVLICYRKYRQTFYNINANLFKDLNIEIKALNLFLKLYWLFCIKFSILNALVWFEFWLSKEIKYI